MYPILSWSFKLLFLLRVHDFHVPFSLLLSIYQLYFIENAERCMLCEFPWFQYSSVLVCTTNLGKGECITAELIFHLSTVWPMPLLHLIPTDVLPWLFSSWHIINSKGIIHVFNTYVKSKVPKFTTNLEGLPLTRPDPLHLDYLLLKYLISSWFLSGALVLKCQNKFLNNCILNGIVQEITPFLFHRQSYFFN